jgi:hypothetical protein
MHKFRICAQRPGATHVSANPIAVNQQNMAHRQCRGLCKRGLDINTQQACWQRPSTTPRGGQMAQDPNTVAFGGLLDDFIMAMLERTARANACKHRALLRRCVCVPSHMLRTNKQAPALFCKAACTQHKQTTQCTELHPVQHTASKPSRAQACLLVEKTTLQLTGHARASQGHVRYARQQPMQTKPGTRKRRKHCTQNSAPMFGHIAGATPSECTPYPHPPPLSRGCMHA